MNGQTNMNAASKWLLWAGIFFLLWNLIGVAAYAAGVILGTLGAIGLLLRKWWAPLAFAFSLIAIIVQFSHPFLFLQQNKGDMAMLGFPIFIIVMAIIQWQLARAWQRKGWLA